MSDGTTATTPRTYRGPDVSLPMRAAILVTEEGREEARVLWHQVFVDEQRWAFRSDNPIDLRVETTVDGRSRLHDMYDDEATYIGVRRGSVLVAAHRLSLPIGGVFHLEKYLAPQGLKLPERFKSARTAEMTRLAVARSARKTRALFLLLRCEFEWLRTEGFTYCFTTAQFPQPGQLYVDLGMLREPMPEFRFDPEDSLPVSLLSGEPPTAHESRLWAMTEPMRERAA